MRPAAVSQIQCPACKQAATVQIDDTLVSGGKVTDCVSCGHDTLYIQKDFNRSLGMAIVVIGVLLSVYFFARSQVLLAMACLGGTALVDLLLHRLVGDVTVCYSCHAIYRGFQKNPEHEPFDLKKLEKYGGRTPRF
jgi:Zn ribbon nucleic-acid-binding protein